MPASDPLHKDAELLFDAVREAGSLAMTLFRQQVRNWSKADGSPVTEADLKVDALLAGKLCGCRPSYGWLSEESPGQGGGECEKQWIVDPIDGTRGFMQGSDEWCIAAALIERGRPVAAAVYRPVCEEFYAAIAGEGATLNGAAIKVCDAATLDGAQVIGNRKSLERLRHQPIVAATKTSIPLQLRLAFVASGRFDATISIGAKNDWDLAAGDLIVHEAGGLAGTLEGAPFRYNRRDTWQAGMIAAGARRHGALVQALRTP